jgi:hypothetical protein
MPEFLDKRKDCTFCNAEAILMNKKVPSYKTSVFFHHVKFLYVCQMTEIVLRNGTVKKGRM